MKKTNSSENLHRNSVPILALEFHYEFMNELKATFSDLKKVKQISNCYTWDEQSLDIEERMKEEVVLVTDLELKIIFASSKIKIMTGYSENEILGKTPKMFQGPDTCEKVLKEIKEAIDMQLPFEKTIENYRKDGRTYKCNIDALPVFNQKGKLSHFIAFEKEDKRA